MKFIVRELGGTMPALGVTGTDHEFDYLDEAFAKQQELEAAGTQSLIATQLGVRTWVESAPVITAIKGEARTRLYAAWKPLHPDEDDSAFTAFLATPEGIEQNRIYRREVTDEVAGRS